MAFGANNLKILDRVIGPVFIDMMNFQFVCCSTHGANLVKFVESQSSIRPSTIFVKNAICSKILGFSKNIHAIIATKFSFFSVRHNLKKFRTGLTFQRNPFFGVFTLHNFFQSKVLTRFRAKLSLSPRRWNRKLFTTLSTHNTNRFTHKNHYR